MSQIFNFNDIFKQKFIVVGTITEYHHYPDYSICGIKYGENDSKYITIETDVEQSLKLKVGIPVKITVHPELNALPTVISNPFDTPRAYTYGVKFVSDTIEELQN